MAELCPVGALGFALFNDFRVSDCSFPNFSCDLDEPTWPNNHIFNLESTIPDEMLRSIPGMHPLMLS